MKTRKVLAIALPAAALAAAPQGTPPSGRRRQTGAGPSADTPPEAANKNVEIRKATDAQWKKLEQLRDNRTKQDQKKKWCSALALLP